MQVLQQQVQAAAAAAAAAAVANVPMYQAPTAPTPVLQETELDLTELENLLHKIMESCTKESISVSFELWFCGACMPCFFFFRCLTLDSVQPSL